MASDLSTVFYTSMPLGTDEVVFAGHSRLASHKDAGGIWRGGDGFYTKRSVESDFSYLRTRVSFGPFGSRTEPGTDIFIMGYRSAAEDPQLHNIRDEFVDNFMMAIHAGRLVVSGVGHGDPWQLDTQSLAAYADMRPEPQAYYRAITNPSPVVKTLNRFGEVRLYINIDPDLAKTLYTITMRQPLMRIDTFHHRSIPVKYAAVLVCADPAGNKLLRDLEAPEHNKWDGGRKRGGKVALKELSDFVRHELTDRMQAGGDGDIRIVGLARFLPSGDPALPSGSPRASGREGSGLPGLGDGTTDESATVQGKPGDSSQIQVRSPKAVHVTVQRPARSTDEPDGKPVTKGKDASGSGKHESPGGDVPGKGQPEEGRSRISAGDVAFRSWSAPSTMPGRTTLQVTLTSGNDVHGDIELVTLGAGGTPEGYTLPVLAASMLVDGVRRDLTWEGNIFKSVKVSGGQLTRLEIELETGRRYRLDVK
jgi:hypothetical protein